MTSWLQQNFYVMTQDTHVATITRQLQQNYVPTLSNYVAIESEKKAHNYVAKETVSHDKSWGTKMKTMSRHDFLCRNKATNWARIFGDPQFQL